MKFTWSRKGHDQEATITFRWMMDEGDFNILRRNPVHGYAEYYLGAVFFGDFKLEFFRHGDFCFTNMLRIYWDNNYDRLEDGTPYGELDDEIEIPSRRTFDSFCRGIEERIVEYLNKDNGKNIRYATTPTIPADWYPGERAKYMTAVTRMD